MCDCDDTPQEPRHEPVVVRGRPRKTIEQKIVSLNSTTTATEEKRKQHNEKMKKYYHDNKEAILLQKKAKRDALNLK